MRPGAEASTRLTVTRRYSWTATASASNPGPRFAIEPGTSSVSPSDARSDIVGIQSRASSECRSSVAPPTSAEDRPADRRGNLSALISAIAPASVAGAHGSMVTTNGNASLVPAGSCSTASILIAVGGERLRDAREDTGTIAYDEAQVVRGHELRVHADRAVRGRIGPRLARSARQRHEIRDDCDRRWATARARPRIHSVAAILAARDDDVLAAVDARERRMSSAPPTA